MAEREKKSQGRDFNKQVFDEEGLSHLYSQVFRIFFGSCIEIVKTRSSNISWCSADGTAGAVRLLCKLRRNAF